MTEELPILLLNMVIFKTILTIMVVKSNYQQIELYLLVKLTSFGTVMLMINSSIVCLLIMQGLLMYF